MKTTRILATPQLQLLAAPALLAHDGRRSDLERKDAALLALLALDGPLPRSRMAALLWPDADTQRARNNLRQRLFRLRRAAGCEVIGGEPTLRLAEGIAHDLASLADDLARDPYAAAGELLGAYDYADCGELDEWVQRARTALRTRRHDVLAAVAAREERQGAIARALQYAERLIADDPLSEQGHRLAMRLHYRRGDRSGALAAHARCVDTLLRELGTAPGAETGALAALIERSDPLPGTTPRPPRTAITRPPRLVGRAAQWRAIAEACERGCAVLLTGDAGMGKSRLLEDCARSRGTVLVAARPGDARVPFAVLARLLRAALATGAAGPLRGAVTPELAAELARVLPELGPAPAGLLQEARFREAVAQTLAICRARGLAGIVVDDLHYADEASLEILPALRAIPLEVVLAVRGTEMPAALATWLRNEGGAGLVAVPLPGLAESEVRELVDALDLAGIDAARIAGPLTRHTGGNPFFVLETLAAVAADPEQARITLPTVPTVLALIERRLGQLSVAASRVVRVAALAGSDVSAALVASVLQCHPVDLSDAWTEATQARVLADDGFVHDLVRDVAATAIPGPIAALLHEGIARHLQSTQAPPARVAHHYAEAGRWTEAAAMHARAADHALRASRRSEEVTQRELAATCFERAGDAAAAFEARRAAVEGVILVRGVVQALQMIDGLVASAASDAQRASALVARAKAELMAADHARGIASARAALKLATRIDSPWLRCDAARMLAVGLAQQGAVAEAEAVILPFRPMVESEGSLEQQGGYWADLAYVLNSARRLGGTADALARAIDCSRALGDLAELATLTSNLATVHGNLGRVDRAFEHARRARALQVELGDTNGPTTGVIDAHVGLYAAALGQYDAALAAFDDALACHRRDGQATWICVCSNNLAATLIDLGQYARARNALDYSPPSVAHVAARGAMLGARLDRLLGTSPADKLARAAAATAGGGDYYMNALIDLERAETMPPREAIAACDAVAAAAEVREYGGIAAKARLLAVQATLAAGDAPSALARWRQLASPLASVQPADMYMPAARAIGHAALLANGEHEEATQVLDAVLRWVNETARSHVPDAFRESFLRRNPVNRALLDAARRRRAVAFPPTPPRAPTGGGRRR